MLFKDIVGQERVKDYLRKTVQESHISHAQLFLGNAGYGGLPLAIAYAQYMVCEDRTDEDSCGVCPPCKKYEKLIHPDLHFVFPVAGPNKPNSDTFLPKWREKIQEAPYFNANDWFNYIGVENKQGIISKDESYNIIRKISLKTFESEYKVMIIWMAELMNTTAANKLLKLLEEPPEKTLFIMLCENTDNMLPTILSRAQLIKIPAIDDKSITAYFSGLSSDISETIIEDAVRLANGDIVEGMRALYSNEEQKLFLHEYITLMRLAWKPYIPELLEWAEKIAGWGREKLKMFCLFVLRITRENLMLLLEQHHLVRLTTEELDFAQKFSTNVNPKALYKIAEEFNLVFLHINANGNAKIVFTDLALQIAKNLKIK